MLDERLAEWQHGHAYGADAHGRGERRTRWVVGITLAMMVGEIVAGSVYGSMALLADGWHMGTHAAALGVAAFAYAYARRHAGDPRYSFGTGKVGALGGFASAVGLAVVALLVLIESATRLAEPVTIHFDEAIAVAVLGLLVNLGSALILKEGHDHGHGDGGSLDRTAAHPEPFDSGAFGAYAQDKLRAGAAGPESRGHDHGHDDHHGDHHGHSAHHRDHNLRAAYLHVLADALTSVLAIVALVAGRTLGWTFMDPVMGIVGALVIARWSVGLLRDTSGVLLDGEVEPARRTAIAQAIEAGGDRVADLHVWRVGPRHLAAIVSVVTDAPRPPAVYRERLTAFPDLVHVTVEVNAARRERIA